MKKISALLIVVLITLGCNDEFLDRASETQIAEDNFWQTESDAYLALNGVYTVLQASALYGGTLNGIQGLTAYDCLSDNALNQWKWEGPGKFMQGTLLNTNSFFSNPWRQSYNGINRVNAVIKNTEDISEELVPLTAKNDLLGQAYFLRALFYFNLSVYFEDVPLITEPQILEEAYVAKNSYSEIYTQVVEDLKKAVAMLPNNRPGNEFGYATKGAALGLFARVQLYNKQYTGEHGVLNLTQQVMGLGYQLHPDYATLFKPESETSSEIVFSIRFLRGDDTNNGESFSKTYLKNPKIDVRPMKNLAKDYYCTDGLPINQSPLYSNADERANRDPRAAATIYFNGDVFMTDPVYTFRKAQSHTGYAQRKYIRNGPDAEGNSVWSQGSQDFYCIRYADVLLMRAEAMAETGDVSGAAAMVDMVRARVNMPSIAQVEGLNAAVTPAEMIEIVRHERRVELAMEGLRFMDIKRWGIVEQAFQTALIDNAKNYQPAYNGKKSEVFPIPQSELDVNKNLVQHPAWQ